MAFKPIHPEKKHSPQEEAATKKLSEQKHILEEERAYRRGLASIQDFIAPSAFEVQASYVRIGGRYARTMFVLGYPRYIQVGWFAPIINFSASFDVAIFFSPLATPLVLKQLRDKVGRVEAEIASGQEKGKPRDPAAETSLRDMEKLRDDLTQGIEHFFSVGVYMTIYADTIEQLEKITEDVEAIFATRLVYTKRVFYQSEQGFNSTSPLCNDELQIAFNMNTSPAAAAFPFISSDLTSDTGILYGINRHNNSLVLFDRFSMQNANETVFATSGAGKSTEWNVDVLLKDRDGIKMVRIGEYIDGLEKKYHFETIDDEMEGVKCPDVQVYTFNKDLKGEWSEVSVAARKAAPEEMFTFRLASGREITVTGDHNMLFLRRGRIVTLRSSEVTEGEVIPLPRRLEEPSDSITEIRLKALLNTNDHIRVTDNGGYSLRSKISKIEIPPIIPVTPEFLRLIGYIISEGTINERGIRISQKEIEIMDDIRLCLKSSKIRYCENSSNYEVILSGKIWSHVFRALGVWGVSATKRIPPFIFNVSNQLAAEFLRGYFEGDGGLERHAVSATSKSKELMSDISYLLLRFGIISRLSQRKKRATNGTASGIYTLLTISGQDFLQKYSEHINFISQRKRDGLSKLLSRKGNTNVWTIPVQDVFQELYDHFSCQLRGVQDVIELKNGTYQPSREKLRDVISQLDDAVERFSTIGKRLHVLSRLPNLNSLITMASCNRELNGAMWRELGDSWRLMKNYAVEPKTQNVFRAVSAISDERFFTDTVRETVHLGFKELNLSFKEYGRSMRDGLCETGDIQYRRLYDAARYVLFRYEMIASRLGRIRELIGRLKTLVGADLEWDRIVSIEKKQSHDRYVYDLTVDNEVFLAGHGGLFVHNSYTVKLEVLRSLMVGVDVIIIDPEREYQHLCEAVGGTYVNISLSSQSRINPFDLPRPVGEQTSTADILRSAVITLKGLLRLMLGTFSQEEDSIMDRALIETYAKKDIIATSDLTKVEPPIMSDLLDVLEGMEGGGSLAEKLKKYTEGTFSGLINHPTNVEMKNQLVVFSVRDLEDELRPIAIYAIVNYIWNVVRSEMKRRILVIDEAWWLMQHEDSARFVFALVKRCRKYYLGVTTITQDVNDFLTSQYGKAILTNSAIQLLLKQSPAAIDIVKKTFLLTEGEKYLLLENAPGEGIFFAGSKHVAIKVVASYAEDQLITTDPRQLLEIEHAKQEFAEASAAKDALGQASHTAS